MKNAINEKINNHVVLRLRKFLNWKMLNIQISIMNESSKSKYMHELR